MLHGLPSKAAEIANWVGHSCWEHGQAGRWRKRWGVDSTTCGGLHPGC